MDENELINLLEMRQTTLEQHYKQLSKGIKRSAIINKCDEINFIITYIRSRQAKTSTIKK